MVERKRLSPAFKRKLNKARVSAANRKHLTEANVLVLQVKQKPYKVWDAGTGAARGLHILVQPSGTTTYRVNYGKSIGLKLGRVGEMTLEEARAETRKIRGLAAKGHDPKQHDPRHAGTFGELLEVWNRDEQKGRKQNKSADRTLKTLKSSCDHWKGKPLVAITYENIEHLLFNKRDSAPYMAISLHQQLRTFFRWAIRTRRLTVNPMAEMPRPWDGAKPRNNPWFKDEAADQVIRDLWAFADRCEASDGAFIKLLLITGKRKKIMIEMQWKDIDKDWNWTPDEGSKTKLNHSIPLPELARSVLKSCPRDRPSVFNNLGSEARTLLSKVREAIKMPKFIWHGVRHIAITKSSELKIPRELRRRVFDYSPGSGADVGYDHYDYRKEKLEALERWCAYIAQVVDPKGVKIFK
jgi:integrase